MPKPKKPAKPVPPKAAEMVRQTWDSTLEALSSAEAEVEKQVKALIKKNRLRVDDASKLLHRLQARVDKERKRATKDVEGRLHDVQVRIKKERHHLMKLANEAVQSALATFNIPSRHEVAELTRKVNELSGKIDRLRRR